MVYIITELLTIEKTLKRPLGDKKKKNHSFSLLFIKSYTKAQFKIHGKKVCDYFFSTLAVIKELTNV